MSILVHVSCLAMSMGKDTHACNISRAEFAKPKPGGYNPDIVDPFDPKEAGEHEACKACST